MFNRMAANLINISNYQWDVTLALYMCMNNIGIVCGWQHCTYMHHACTYACILKAKCEQHCMHNYIDCNKHLIQDKRTGSWLLFRSDSVQSLCTGFPRNGRASPCSPHPVWVCRTPGRSWCSRSPSAGPARGSTLTPSLQRQFGGGAGIT